MKIPMIAIIGRPNVGKSTLFNVLTGGRTALTDDVEGTTRDRIFKKVSTPAIDFFLVDTGGVTFEKEDQTIENDVKKQALIAIEEADMVVFLLNRKEPIGNKDQAIIDLLRKKATDKTILLVISQCDLPLAMEDFAPYYRFGLGEPIPISAVHRRGIDALIDRITQECKKRHFLTKDDPAYDQDQLNTEWKAEIAIVGKPNVGKSSLVNAWLNKNRVIVSAVPGTTRDAIDTPIRVEKESYNLIDTAGIKKAGRIKGLEKYSILRTMAALSRCHIALLVVDSSEPISHQDQHIASLILNEKKGMVILANKWDLRQAKGKESEEEKQKLYLNHLHAKFPFLPWAPVVFTSATHKKNMRKIFDLFDQIQRERSKRVETRRLNLFLQQIIARHLPTGTKSARPKIYYITQVATDPPHFVVFVNRKECFHFSYVRYLENQLRKTFGFLGTSISIDFREKKDKLD